MAVVGDATVVEVVEVAEVAGERDVEGVVVASEVGASVVVRWLVAATEAGVAPASPVPQEAATSAAVRAPASVIAVRVRCRRGMREQGEGAARMDGAGSARPARTVAARPPPGGAPPLR